MSRAIKDKIVVPPDMTQDALRIEIGHCKEILDAKFYTVGATPDENEFWLVYKEKLEEALADLILLSETDEQD